MMVRWMCGVSLNDRKRSVDLYGLLGVQSVDRKDRKRSVDLCSFLGVENVAEVIRHGRLRWFGHVERKNEDDGGQPVGMWWWQG